MPVFDAEKNRPNNPSDPLDDRHGLSADCEGTLIEVLGEYGGIALEEQLERSANCRWYGESANSAFTIRVGGCADGERSDLRRQCIDSRVRRRVDRGTACHRGETLGTDARGFVVFGVVNGVSVPPSADTRMIPSSVPI